MILVIFPELIPGKVGLLRLIWPFALAARQKPGEEKLDK
jgi:hypothetical protein